MVPCSFGYSVQILETFLFSGPSLFESVCERESPFFFRVLFSFQKFNSWGKEFLCFMRESNRKRIVSLASDTSVLIIQLSASQTRSKQRHCLRDLLYRKIHSLFTEFKCTIISQQRDRRHFVTFSIAASSSCSLSVTATSSVIAAVIACDSHFYSQFPLCIFLYCSFLALKTRGISFI